MPDRFGPRGVFAIMIPIQNSNQQPEFELLRPEGINNQIYRFDISDQSRVPAAMVESIGGSLGCWPDVVICGNSVEMRDWSLERHEAYKADLRAQLDGQNLVMATDACVAALRTIGAKRIAIFTPMEAHLSKSAEEFYEAHGFEITGATWLDVKHSIDIIKVSVDDIVTAFDRIDASGVDAILHLGGALGIVSMIAELEEKIGKPIISVNAATYWYALRQHGIADPIPGYGQLLMTDKIAE
jgi:maleate isomerase